VGLAAAVRGNVGPWQSPSFRELLEDYHGAVRSDKGIPFIAHLVNGADYKFEQLVLPQYPAIAVQARVRGKVELELQVDSVTGRVLDVKILSGPALLRQSAIDSAKRWLFVRDSAPSQVSVTLDYSLTCP
jgi:hypothetical protein